MNASARDAASAVHWTALNDLQQACARGDTPESYSQTVAGCVFVEDRAGLASDEALARWLQQLACPVVVLAPPGAYWNVAADCRITDVRDAQTIQATVEHAPLAALSFVQVLRSTADLSPQAGLTIESMAYGLLQDGPEFRRWRERYSKLPSANAEPAVLLERHGAELQVRLNRPHARNALDLAMRDALVEAFELVAADTSIERLQVSGIGPCYSVGGDLAEFGLRADGASAHQVRSLRHPARALLRCADRARFDLHGACIGSGSGLPAFAARVRARRDACFQLPELRLGLIPGSGGCISLPRRIGRQRTAWLGLSGDRIGAEAARTWGLVDELID